MPRAPARFDEVTGASYSAGILQGAPSFDRNGREVRRPVLVSGLALVFLAFAFTRLPFLLDWRLPLAFPDTATYLWPLEAMESGQLPQFDLRTPGYPLFWRLCRLVSARVSFVIYLQMAISLATALAAVLLIWRHVPRLTLPVAATLAVFVSANAHLMWDVTLLSESVFTSTIVVWLLSLYLSLVTRRTWYGVMAGVAAVVAISLRPSAIALLGINTLAGVWLYRRRAPGRSPLALSAPVVIFVATLVLYNRLTIGVTALSGGSTWAYLWSTTLYLDPDPSLLPAINAAMAAKNEALSPNDRSLIYGDSTLRAFRDALERNIGAGIGQIADRVTGWPTRTGWKYMEHRSALQRAVRLSIERRPRVYLRNVAGTFIDCFRFITVPHPDYYRAFPAEDLYRHAFVEQPFYVRNLGEYYNPSRPARFVVSRDAATGAVLVTAPPSRLAAVYARFARWRSRAFENTVWMWTLPIGALAGIALPMRRRTLSAGSVAWLACVAAVAGNALMAGLIGHTEPRYAQPMHFANYLSLAFLPEFLRSWNAPHE